MIHIRLPIEVGHLALEAMRARLERHLFGRAKILTTGAPTLGAVKTEAAGEHFCCGFYLGYTTSCVTCGAPCDCKQCLEEGDECPNCEGLLMQDRVILDRMAGVIRPCPACRPAEYAAMVEKPAPVDPWDMSAEEQADGAIRLTARELVDGEGGSGYGVPSRFGRDRAGADDMDDRGDLQPFTPTTRFPWEPR